jgi:hypothetical protein
MTTQHKKQRNESVLPELGSAAEFETLLRSGMDDLTLKTGSHQETWGLGREEQWYLDDGSGEVIFTFPELVVSAPAQVIGTWDQETRMWTWAWADPLVPQELQVEAGRVREYGAQHGFQHLVNGSWEAEESHCWYMTALACWLCDAKGAYRGVTGSACTFLIFGDVLFNPINETPIGPDVESFVTNAVEDFKLCGPEPEAQREACCRYLKLGAVEGIDQPELIHRLGLASPSVLELAGYSPDGVQSIMDQLRTISDEEIENCADRR